MAGHIDNPFDLHPVKDLKGFIGRKDILEKIDSCCLESQVDREPDHIFITGPYHFGKTSLLNILNIIIKDKGYISLDARPRIEENPEKYFARIHDELKEEMRVFYNNIIAVGPFDSTNIKKSFEDLSIIHKKPIILYLDDYDSIDTNLLKRIDEIFSFIKSFILIFVGERRLDNDFRFDNRLLPVELQRFNIKEITDCIEKPLMGKHKIDKSTIKIINYLTNGHPYAVKLLAYNIYYNYSRKKCESLSFIHCISKDPEIINEICSQLRNKCKSEDYTFIKGNMNKLMEAMDLLKLVELI